MNENSHSCVLDHQSDNAVVTDSSPPKNRRKSKKKARDKERNCFVNVKFAITPIIKPSSGFVIKQKLAKKNVPINIAQHIPSGSEYFYFESNMKKMTPVQPRSQENAQNKSGWRSQRSKPSSKKGPGNNSNQQQAASTDASPRQQSGKNQKDEKKEFLPYLSKEETLAGIKDGTIFQGILRINPNQPTSAFCPNADRSEPDYLINSLADRNRALEGDVVAVRMLPDPEVSDRNLFTVVHILERVHPRIAAGHLSILYQCKRTIPVFTPRDKRFPRMNIRGDLPPNFMRQHKKYEQTLFIAKLVEWDTPRYGIGTIVEKLGESCDLMAENKAILLENNIHFENFSPEALSYMPPTFDLTDDEIKRRLDLRDECIFTIDPLSARDLDDAVHVKSLPNGNFEIGVHIADVSYYLHEDTPLDELVAMRATTTYLVDNVYHMLPRDMCMACSLLPGRDCAAFSVIWEMTKDGTVVEKKFARTVIANCTQLAYEHAQWMIMNPNATSWPVDLPKIYRYTPADIHKSVLILHNIAQQMRQRRYENGALYISQIKLAFMLNSNGDPIDYYQQETKEANNLIEEFMLQANISVAEKIYHVFPDLAFLRCHDEPNPRMINNVREKLEMIGIHLNVESSGDIHKSIHTFKALGPDEYPKFVAINHMLTKPMTRATYFCSNGREFGDFYHYALSIPIYTHFTSPIRRYADVVVHRLLAAAIGLRDKPIWGVEKFRQVAQVCNEMKFNAKNAGEASCDLMLTKYIQAHQPFVVPAVVVQVFEKYFEIIVLSLGKVMRIFTNEVENATVDVETDEGPNNIKMIKLLIHYVEEGQQPCTQLIDIFQVVNIALTYQTKYMKLHGSLLRPGYNFPTRTLQ